MGKDDMRLIVGTLTAVGLLVAAPAVAQQGAAKIGMQVTDTSGAPVGTVVGIKDANLLVRTDKHDALLPAASFRPRRASCCSG